jgi:predicted RNase H-like HicB family nuclease
VFELYAKRTLKDIQENGYFVRVARLRGVIARQIQIREEIRQEIQHSVRMSA